MRFTECQKYMHNNFLMKNHVGKLKAFMGYFK